jgi:hypothetical protein
MLASLNDVKGFATNPRLAPFFDEVGETSLIIMGEGAEVGDGSDREGKQWGSVGHAQRVTQGRTCRKIFFALFESFF